MIACSGGCGATFDGTRSAARAALWEPDSFRTQADIDFGPMTCPECFLRVLDELSAAMQRHARG